MMAFFYEKVMVSEGVGELHEGREDDKQSVYGVWRGFEWIR